MGTFLGLGEKLGIWKRREKGVKEKAKRKTEERERKWKRRRFSRGEIDQVNFVCENPAPPPPF